jgi:hypothetical protein
MGHARDWVAAGATRVPVAASSRSNRFYSDNSSGISLAASRNAPTP